MGDKGGRAKVVSAEGDIRKRSSLVEQATSRAVRTPATWNRVESKEIYCITDKVVSRPEKKPRNRPHV